MAEHKTIFINNFELHYWVSGQSNEEAILLLHPAFSDHNAFELNVESFEPHFKVITVDLIGHGLSKALNSKDKLDTAPEHLCAVLDAEKVERTHVVGVSMGSLVAQYFAWKHPEKVRSLIGLGGYSIHKSNKAVAKAQRKANFKLLLKALFSMKGFRLATANLTAVTPHGQAVFLKSSMHYERKSFAVMQGLQHVIEDRVVTDFPYPVLILVGEKDIPLAMDMAKEWHRSIPGSELKVLIGAGHCANMDDFEMFNHLVLDFLQTVSDSKTNEPVSLQ